MLLDIAFLVSVAYGIFQGFTSGFFGSTLRVVRYILALILSMRASYLAMYFLQDRINVDAAYLPLLSFVLMYILVLALITTISNSMSSSSIWQNDKNNFLSKGIGVALWSFILSFLFSAFIAFAEQSRLISPTVMASSSVYPYIADIYPVIKCKLGYIAPVFGDIFNSFRDLFADLASQIKGDCCN